MQSLNRAVQYKPAHTMNLPIPKPLQIHRPEVCKTIPRYLVPQAPLQMRTQHTSPSQAAAIKSMEQRHNIRNTVVYNRVAATPQRNYEEEDDYYSD